MRREWWIETALTAAPWLCLLVVALVLTPRVMNVWSMPAQQATLVTPRPVGTVTTVEISAIIFDYNADGTLKELRISAIETDAQGKVHGGEGYSVPASNLPAAVTTLATDLKRRALANYLARKGYAAVVN